MWCGSAAAVIAVVTMTVTTLWNSGNLINIGKNTSVFSSVGDSSEQSDSASEQNLSIPSGTNRKAECFGVASENKINRCVGRDKTDLIQPLGCILQQLLRCLW